MSRYTVKNKDGKRVDLSFDDIYKGLCVAVDPEKISKNNKRLKVDPDKTSGNAHIAKIENNVLLNLKGVIQIYVEPAVSESYEDLDPGLKELVDHTLPMLGELTLSDLPGRIKHYNTDSNS